MEVTTFVEMHSDLTDVEAVDRRSSGPSVNVGLWLGTEVRSPEFEVCFTPRNRRSRWGHGRTAVDPKEKSAISEEAEHWPLNAAREASQDRGQSWPPWPGWPSPFGRGSVLALRIRK